MHAPLSALLDERQLADLHSSDACIQHCWRNDCCVSKQEMMEAPGESKSEAWFSRIKPEGFAGGADVVLVLPDDDNKEVPAHSAFLAAQSQVLCDMSYRSPLSDCKPVARSGGEAWRVPLPNTNLEQATRFLKVVYFQEEINLPNKAAVLAMIDLLHRLNCPAALEKLDVYIACHAGNLKAWHPKFWVT